MISLFRLKREAFLMPLGGQSSPMFLKPSSIGRRTTNFAATPDKSRSKFARAYNPPTLRNITESKIFL